VIDFNNNIVLFLEKRTKNVGGFQNYKVILNPDSPVLPITSNLAIPSGFTFALQK
jgi:hypothetical protein